ncbi:MAG: NAD(P)-binding domain-containing protein [Bacteroidetes bacterium]|nr:NAD(P)-binding domain-containing protein [Bacteroidota bacterium]
MKKVLFLDSVHPLIPEELSAHGFTCDFFTEQSKEELMKIVDQYFGIIIRSRIRLDKEILGKAAGLKFIGRVGAGMENIDVAYAEERNILCFNSPEGNRDAVGEHTTGMLLSMMNHLNRADIQVREGKWNREENRGTEIKGKTVGIIGYGNMGSAFAQRLRGFDATVISYDKYKTGYSDGNTRETTLEEIFGSADIVSIHVPLTEETRFMCDKKFFSTFKKNIWFINTSRGPVVRTTDLAGQIRAGKIIAAALDVLEYEDTSFQDLSGQFPEAFRFLLSSDRVILTPHIAGWTAESEVRLAKVLVEKIVNSPELKQS